ncbi:MAG: hypothetical protein FJX74_12755, partial [Armatimonadetes bacterium]|nr:hypothetical protein [Armatimonadota bacterium]
MGARTAEVQERDGRVCLANGLVRFEFGLADHGALISIRDLAAGTELVRDAQAPRLLWRVGLRQTATGEMVWRTSAEAGRVEWHARREGDGAVLMLLSAGLPGSDLEVTVEVTLGDDSPLTAWRAAVRGVGEAAAVVELACPILSGLVKLGGPAPGEALLAPVQGEAYVYRTPFPVRDGLPLCAGAGPESADVGVGSVGGRYPGAIAVQMMALYNDRAGLYFAAHDAGQHPKDFRMGLWPGLGEGPVLSLTHLLSERPGESVELPYETMVGVFHGDWHDAAALYRAWATQQWWCEKKLWERDIPGWMRQGVGGVFQMSNYHIPRLDLNHSLAQIADTVNEISAKADVPLLALLFNWEGGGAWTGPEGLFPPREGEAAFRAAMAQLRNAGNLGFVYIPGNNWYVRIGYDPQWDSWPAFRAAGETLALRRPDGEYTVMSWYGN